MRDRGGEAPDPSRGGVEETGELPNLGVRLVQLFTAPGNLFRALAGRPVWVGALTLAVGLALATTVLMPEELVRAMVEAQAPPDAPAEDIDRGVEFFGVVGYVAAVAGPPLLALILAGVFLFIFNVAMGGEASFRQAFSVSTHAILIPTVGGLVTLPLMIATGDPQATLSLHLLAPELAEGFLRRFLRGMNVFSLWAAGVLGVAASQLYPARSAGAAAGVLVALYVAFKAGTAALGLG